MVITMAKLRMVHASTQAAWANIAPCTETWPCFVSV